MIEWFYLQILEIVYSGLYQTLFCCLLCVNFDGLFHTPTVSRVLSRVYRFGEKSRVVEDYEVPRGVRGHEMNMR